MKFIADEGGRFAIRRIMTRLQGQENELKELALHRLPPRSGLDLLSNHYLDLANPRAYVMPSITHVA